ncbi:MAG: hypothetical protein WB771_13720 [Solirubrobacterales bacterium]
MTRTTTGSVAASGSFDNRADCAPGETLISGGGGFDFVIDGEALARSYKSGNGWRIFGRNDTASSQTYTVEAYCLQ